ncbi:MAG: hypothetical protein KF823_02875 [Xanthomonadales bacterium]|nr:hypothetical protein [Xanthomonadales bacterium]
MSHVSPLPTRCRPGIRPWVLLALLIAASAQAGTPPPGGADLNLLPNSRFLGSGGAVEGNVTGTVPAAWRGFAVGGAALGLQADPIAADALFPGSPATFAMRVTVTARGADQGFDNAPWLFALQPGRGYRAGVWVRSGNPGMASQGFSVSMPFFDADLAYTGRDPGAFAGIAGPDWTWVEGPLAVAEAGDAYAQIAIRLADDGGQDILLVALPRVPGPPVGNDVPNPQFVGSGGVAGGAVTGTVPDHWRAFALNSTSLSLERVSLPAHTLFQGAPPASAMRMAVGSGDGGSAALDHELARARLLPGHLYYAEVFLRSGNAGGSAQQVLVNVPVFAADGTFTGQQPGTFQVTVGPEWTLVAGPPFRAEAGTTANLAFRPQADGDDDIVLVAAPRLVGPTEALFVNGFE